VQFEPAGVRHGIPAVGLPMAMPYGGRIVGANGLSISTPCPRKLASDRRILLARPSAPDAAPQVLPVVGLDFRGPWQVGYASLARVSPAGIATLPDGSHVKVSGAPWTPFSLPYRRAPMPDPYRGGHPAHARVGDLVQPVPIDAPGAVATPTTLDSEPNGPSVLVPTANDFGQVLGPAGSNAPLGRAEIDTGLSQGADFLAGLSQGAASAASFLPSWGQFTTLIVCVLVAVGVWFLWPILSGLRHMGV
jgi:hypothetical protein